MRNPLLRSILASCVLGMIPCAATAGIHTWDVSEVFSNADGTVQFVELMEANGGNNEGNVGNGSITSNTQSFSWTNGAVSNTANRFYLLATQGFADLPGAPPPDAIIPAGSVPFFDVTGDSVDFVIYDTCTFGPIPTDGIDSFDCVTSTTGVATPTNYAGCTNTLLPASITLDHVDDFQCGTTQNWSGGSNPIQQPDGGPGGGLGGAGDGYLEISAGGLTSLGAFNTMQWAGDYGAQGMTSVDFDLNNFGPDPLSLRVTLFTPGCNLGPFTCTAWTSTVATALASGSGWVTASFSLDEADLTRVFGTETYADSIQNVERLLIRHDDGTPDPPGTPTPVDATLGIDNVTALPEPGTLAGLAAGALALVALRRRRGPGAAS